MQTFLPYQSYRKSAEVLDRQRLGKQRVENLQIMKCLVHGGGWQNHPAVKMWRHHESALLSYQDAICQEWVRRGYQDTCWVKSVGIWRVSFSPDGGTPPWLGDQAFHLSHQSNLVRKDPVFYQPKFPGVADNLPYVWPV